MCGVLMLAGPPSPKHKHWTQSPIASEPNFLESKEIPAQMTRKNTALVLSILFMSTLVYAQQNLKSAALGEVRGKVVDQAGTPVEGATVYAYSPSMYSRAFRSRTTTDQQGTFLLQSVWPEPVTIFGYKDSEFYGDPIKSYRSVEAIFPAINLHPGEKVDNVLVHLGERSGLLRLRLIDLNTSQPIEVGSLWVCPDGGVTKCVRGTIRDQDSRFIPNGAISIKIKAYKYEEWEYRNSETDTTLLAVRGGETRDVVAKLQKKNLASVTGIVLDQRGKPVKRATVYWLPAREGPPPGLTPSIAADKKGRFVLNELEPEPISIGAYKESEYYSNQYSVPSYARITTVDLQPGENRTGVIVRIGRKDALLELRVLDANTKQPLRGIFLEWCFTDRFEPQSCLSSSSALSSKGVLKRFVPARPLFLIVKATAYEDWKYQGKAKHAESLSMVSGETHKLTIYMKPKLPPVQR